MADATYTGSSEGLSAMFAELLRATQYRGNSYERFVQPVLERIGVALLSQVQQAFIVKSRGGRGSDGITWEPLKRETVAQRRIGDGDLEAIGVKGRKIPADRVYGLLTADQDDRRRKIFGQVYMRNVFELGHDGAAAKAGAIAWTVLKGEGAQTKLDVLGGRQVDTLRDTGVLLRSLSPTTAALQPEGQVFECSPGMVTVGTNIKPWHHRGIPGKLPARPFWPVDDSIPEPWWDAIVTAAGNGIREALFLLVQENRVGR